MRKYMLIILSLVFAFSLSATPVIDTFTGEQFNRLFNSNDIGYDAPKITLGPYYSTSGINMASKSYPSRKDVVGSLAFEGGDLPENVTKDKYYNGNMIALGALYDIPVAYKVDNNVIDYGSSYDEKIERIREEGSGFFGKKYLWRKTETSINTHKVCNIAILSSSSRPSMRFSAESSSDFMFVSQSNPTYRRPFEIAIQPKYRTSYYAYYDEYHDVESTAGIVKTVGVNLDNNPEVVFPSDVSLDNYVSFWIDVILALPRDDFDMDNGVQVDNIRYELVEADDYSSVVNLSISYSPLTYEIYEVTYIDKEVKVYEAVDYHSALDENAPIATMSWGDPIETEKTSETTLGEQKNEITYPSDIETITIAFSGYYSPYSNESTESKASFHVNTYPIVSNLNLNPSSSTNPRTFIDIADINLIYLYGERQATRDEAKNENFYNSCNEVTNLQSTQNPRIFLSASNDPKEQNPNGFLFVHKGATRIVEGVNAVRYSVRVTDDKGRFTDFDGTDYIDGNYQMVGTDKFLYSEHHYTNPFWHVVYDTGNIRLMHYHSYDGTVSILIDDTDQNLMQAGVYESTIYVHLITP